MWNETTDGNTFALILVIRPADKPWRPNWLQGKAAMENGMLTSAEATLSISAFRARYCWVNPATKKYKRQFTGFHP